jgi:hypothetical protein
MPKTIFISYSRRETPFVDALLDDLEDSDIQTWVDYQSLIPGKPWFEQILAGINATDIFLLVVSKAAIVSQNVEFEYKYALKQKKRIILVIFESVPLPAGLQACEWVDFRGSFDGRYQTLLKQFEQPVVQSPAPQKGFKAPAIIWLTFAISLLMVVISIPSWWTIYIPALLIPLPLGILKRDFHYYRIRFAVLTLPPVLVLSWVFSLSYHFTHAPFEYCIFASFLISPALFFLISSKGMRLWGKPGASVPQFANPYHPETEHPEPMSFFIEHAPEDSKYADAIANALTGFGHLRIAQGEQAQINFAIISGYKNTISMDSEKHVIFPIIIQDTVIENKALQRIQWIDFRRGLRHLNDLAKLLSTPAKLMKAIGVAPISGYGIYPRIIQMLDYFLTLLAFFSVGIWIPLSIEFGGQFIHFNRLVFMDIVRFVSINIILSAAILNTVFSARRALVSRKGALASLGRLTGALLWVGFVGFTQTLYMINIIITETATTGAMIETSPQGTVVLFQPFSFVVGMILIVLFGIWNWGDLITWFPTKQEE